MGIQKQEQRGGGLTLGTEMVWIWNEAVQRSLGINTVGLSSGKGAEGGKLTLPLTKQILEGSRQAGRYGDGRAHGPATLP